MKLIHYLNDYFYTEEQLIQQAKTDPEKLLALQNLKVMPKASYIYTTHTNCVSFFGDHVCAERSKYYCKGYLSWLRFLLSLEDPAFAEQFFIRRYRGELARLYKLGLICDDLSGETLDQTLQETWQHFLNGTYGVCTKNGQPEQIAAKELLIRLAAEYAESTGLEAGERQRLRQILTLLDQVVAPFAPHERPVSSRQKYILHLSDRFDLSIGNSL